MLARRFACDVSLQCCISRGKSDNDSGYSYRQVLLPVPDLASGGFSPSPSVYVDLFALEEGVEYLGDHFGAIHKRRADLDVALVADQQDTVKLNFRGILGQLTGINAENVAFVHTELLSTVFYNRIHLSDSLLLG